MCVYQFQSRGRDVRAVIDFSWGKMGDIWVPENTVVAVSIDSETVDTVPFPLECLPIDPMEKGAP